MRKMLMITAATLAMGVTGAIAAPHHGGGFSHGGVAMSGRSFGSAGAGMAQGKMMASPQTSVGIKGNNLAARNNVAPSRIRNNFAAAPNRAHRSRYARNGHRGWYGGGWGGYDGLYAYEPGYDTCYDYGYGPYYNGYYNNCAYNYNQGPGFTFGFGW